MWQARVRSGLDLSICGKVGKICELQIILLIKDSQIFSSTIQPSLRTTKDNIASCAKKTCFWHEPRDPHHCYHGERACACPLMCMSSSVLHIAILHSYSHIGAAGPHLCHSGLLRHMCPSGICQRKPVLPARYLPVPVP